MKQNRKLLFLAVLFVLALPLMFTGNAAAFDTHVDGATINTVGGWDMPTGPSGGDTYDNCLWCHRSGGAASTDKQSYLMTGHRNMLKEVGANGIPLGGPEWTAGEGGSSPYAGIDWATGENGDGDVVAYLWGGWYRNSVEARIGQHAKTADSPSTVIENGAYCGAACHTTGPDALDASVAILGVTGQYGSSNEWVAEGVQCSRCHNDTSDDGSGLEHHDAGHEGVEATELCFECHEQGGIAEGIEVGVGHHGSGAGDVFDGHYRTNQFLNSPHARFEGSIIGDEAFYDTFFDGGCTTCHDVHIGAADPANTDQSHIISRCGVECHNPQSPYSHGGYAGFHDYFGGLAPNTTSTEDNCSKDHDNQIDCEADGGYWNAAGTVGNNTKGCVSCHMGPGTNHLFRNNVDPDYTPFTVAAGPANSYDEDGYPAVGNDIGLICGQCHYESGNPLVGTKLSLLQLVSFAEDYHGHEAAQSGSCAVGATPCTEDAQCTENVCSRTIMQVCTVDGDCPTNETCVTEGEICQFFAGPGGGNAYARFNWYRGTGCFEINFDASDNDGTTYEWNFGDGNTGSGEITSHNFPSEGSYIVTLTVDGDKQRTINIPVSGNSFQVGKPAKISGTIPAYYLTLQDAYDNAVNGDTIQSKETSFNENLYFDSDTDIFFEGGYNCGYTSITGITTLNGDMTISKGTFTIQNGMLAVI